MPNTQKSRTVADLKQLAQQATALYFLDYTRVGANDLNMLRRRLGSQGVAVRVVKNRLALIALAELGIASELRAVLCGPTSVIFAGEDPVAPARTIRELMHRLEALKFKGAYLDGKLYDAGQFSLLAGLPTKPELRSQVVGALQSPMWELVNGIGGLLNELVWILEQLKERTVPTAG